MTRVERKYPFLEYLFTGEPAARKAVLFGSALRAIGKGWSVQVISDDERWDELAASLVDSDQVQRGESVRRQPNIVILDADVASDQVMWWRDRPEICGRTHILCGSTVESTSEFDLISHFSTTNVPSPLQFFVGDGKGKTTAALGAAWLATPRHNVVVIQWFKERATTPGRLQWAISEHSFPERLQDSTWEFYPTGLGFFGSPALDRVTGETAVAQHRMAAEQGLKLAHQLLTTPHLSALVLDELLDTLKEVSPTLPTSLLPLSQLTAFFEELAQQSTPTFVTGRKVLPAWQECASVTTVQALRHPWKDQKRAAVSGLDF